MKCAFSHGFWVIKNEHPKLILRAFAFVHRAGNSFFMFSAVIPGCKLKRSGGGLVGFDFIRISFSYNACAVCWAAISRIRNFHLVLCLALKTCWVISSGRTLLFRARTNDFRFFSIAAMPFDSGFLLWRAPWYWKNRFIRYASLLAVSRYPASCNSFLRRYRSLSFIRSQSFDHRSASRPAHRQIICSVSS